MATMDIEVKNAEEELLLKAFADFRAVVKQMKMGGELRVAMEIDRTTGEPEIIFAGYNFKRSLESTRTVYSKRREQTTFGQGKGAPVR